MSETTEPGVDRRFVYKALGILFPGNRMTADDIAGMVPDARDQVDRLARVLADHNAELLHLQKFATMVADLDRNEHGRHEGDIDGSAPSQGNPRLQTGDVLGYSLGGAWRYVMPERGKRHDPDAWRVRNDA